MSRGQGAVPGPDPRGVSVPGDGGKHQVSPLRAAASGRSAGGTVISAGGGGRDPPVWGSGQCFPQGPDAL